MLGLDQESGYKEEAELLKIEDGFSNVSPISVYINYSNQQSHIFVCLILQQAVVRQYPVNQHLYIYLQ